MSRKLMVVVLSIFCFTHCYCQTQLNIKHLEAFAKLYGYIRFFHPSDEGANLDWSKYAIYGTKEILKCNNDKELYSTLKKLFYPIAPTIQFYNQNTQPDHENIIYDKDTTSLNVVAWQHLGVWFSDESNTYRSYRVLSNAQIDSVEDYPSTNSLERTIQKKKLFTYYPPKGKTVTVRLTDSLSCKVPITLYTDDIITLGKNIHYPMKALINEMDAYDISKMKWDNINLRAGGIIIAWNNFQHFYPYFEEIKTNWDDALKETLTLTFSDKTEIDYYYTLCKMVAILKDGHINVNFRKSLFGGIPIKVNLMKKQVVVVKSNETLFKVGDIIKEIDNKPVMEKLNETKQYSSDSPHSLDNTALWNIFDGPQNSQIQVKINRNGEDLVINYLRKNKWSQIFVGYTTEFNYPAYKKLNDSTVYINCNCFTTQELQDSIKQLSRTKYLIMDVRDNINYGRQRAMQIAFSVLVHLLDQPVYGMKIYVPQQIYPDGINKKYKTSQHYFEPAEPHFTGKTIIITSPDVGSAYESFLTAVKYNKLAKIVGGTSSGCNGNINVFTIPGPYDISFTGMKVTNPDDTQNELIGIKPDYPVERTIKALLEGKDECYEKVLEIIRDH
jgi:C-terminal processing protease CtpA/Prc